MDEVVCHYHSNETSSAVLSHDLKLSCCLLTPYFRINISLVDAMMDTCNWDWAWNPYPLKQYFYIVPFVPVFEKKLIWDLRISFGSSPYVVWRFNQLKRRMIANTRKWQNNSHLYSLLYVHEHRGTQEGVNWKLWYKVFFVAYIILIKRTYVCKARSWRYKGEFSKVFLERLP